MPRFRLASLLGSLLPRRRSRSPRVVRPWADDSERGSPLVGLTPRRLLALLRAADAGDPRAQFELYEDMLQRWPRLAAVETTRRVALTGLEWSIAPAVARDGLENSLAPRAAEACRAALDAIEHWPDVLQHLACAIGRGVAVAELVWERSRLVDVVPVPWSRLRTDPAEPWRVRVRTEDEPDGLALDAQPRKWIVHRPGARPGRTFDGGLLRAAALLFLAQHLSFHDWLVQSQLVGAPLRIAQVESGASERERSDLLTMLRSLGNDAVAVFDKAIELRFVEPQRAEGPYRALQDHCNTEITILWLGQHLTTDIQAHGSRAAAEVHDRVREDLLAADMAEEAATLRRDLLAPLVQSLLGDGVPTPHFRRALLQSIDSRALAQTLGDAARNLGLRIPRRWAHQALGVPEPQPGEPVIGAPAAAPA